MTPSFDIRGRLLARNAVMNFIGQGAPLLVGVITIPLIVRGLGTERFGLLSLAWVILGYFTVFDLGLGRATTKFVAEALGRGEEDQIPRLVWTAVTVQGVFGILGAVVLVGITPLLVERILSIPPMLVQEATASFYLLALAIPVVLISGSFRGVLEAKQRFDLVNAVRIPSNTLVFLLPLVGLILGLQLPGIVALILVSRFVTLLALIALDFQVLPTLRGVSTSFGHFPTLLSYGAWVTITNIVGPLMVYLDRFLIASLLSLGMVAYYTAPFEAVTRFWIIPASLLTTLFPAFSTLGVVGHQERLEALFARSLKYLVLVLGPLILLLVLFAEEILQAWLGSDFAMQSTVVLQMLALGVLFSSLSHIPYALLQGVGRPDLTAKINLLELPIYMMILWILIGRWGIAGVAAAWMIRAALDALLSFVASFGVCQFRPALLGTNGLPTTLMAFLLLVGVAWGLRSLVGALSLPVQSILFILLFGLFAWITWRKALDTSDRDAIMTMMKPP